MDRVIRRLAGQAWVHMLVAFLGMGGWALYANWGHPAPKPLVSALAQGALSATITFAMKRGLDRLRAPQPTSRGLWMPPLAICSVALSVLVGMHLLVGTPELVKTIAVPFSVATTYAIAYNSLMWTKGRPS